MGWLWLGLAIALEVSGTIAMKYSAGFTRLLPSILMFVCYGASFTCLNFALGYMQVSVAYAVWSGIGIVLIALFGFLFFQEKLSIHAMLWICVIMAGVIGLNLSSRGHG